MTNKQIKEEIKQKYLNCEFYNKFSKNRLSCYSCNYAGYCLMNKLKSIEEIAKENVFYKNDVFDDYEKLGITNLANEILKIIGE